MSTQILYPLEVYAETPAGNNFRWANQSNAFDANLALLVDEGVATANDSDYIQNRASNGFSSPINLNFRMGPCLVYPQYVTVRYRARDGLNAVASAYVNTMISFLTRNPPDDPGASGGYNTISWMLTQFDASGDSLPLTTSFHDYTYQMDVIYPGESNEQVGPLGEEYDLSDTWVRMNFGDTAHVFGDNYLAGLFQLSAMEIEISGEPREGFGSTTGSLDCFLKTTDTIDGSLPLYTTTQSASLNNLPLYVQNTILSASGSLPLIMSGQYIVATGLPLYCHNQGAAASLDLYEAGHIAISSYMNLYTIAAGPNAGMNLALRGLEPQGISGSLPLLAFGATAGTSGLMNSLPLYLDSVGFASQMNLSLQGASTVNVSGAMNLYTRGASDFIERSLSLALANNAIPSSLPLYTAGRGFSEPDPSIDSGGFLPTAGGMNLYLKRPNDVAWLPLFLENRTVASGLDAYIFGAHVTNSSLNLAMPNTIGTPNRNLRMFTHGY